MIDFQQIFAALPSPYMVLDRDLNYVAVNRAYEAAVKLPADALVGRNLFALFPNDDESGQRLRQSLQSVLATGRSDTIAFIPYAIPRSEADGGGFEERYWTAVHTPLRDAGAVVAFVMQNTVDVTDLVRSGAMAWEKAPSASGVEVLERAREAERAYRESLAESSEFRRLFAQAPGMIAILSGPDHRFTFANDPYLAFTGGRVLDGRSVRDVFPETVDQGFVGLLDGVYRTGQPQSGEGMRVILDDEAKGKREAFIDFNYQPIRDGAGRINGIFVQGTDRTAQYRTLQRQRLLLDELNHRVKNTLSTVQSIARRSFRGVDDAGFEAFEARIRALSNVHDMISDRHWERIGLELLLRRELAAFDATDRVEIAGPPVELTPRAGIALAMVFHELASNAVKYGPLAGQGDGLSAVWGALDAPNGARHLLFEWREAGNRSAPQSWMQGFGMRTLRRIVEGELDGSLTLDLDADGLICRFRVALDEVGPATAR